MNRSFLNATFTFTVTALLVLVTSVACQRSKQYSSFGDIPDDTQGGYQTPKTNLPQKKPNAVQASAPKAVPTCFPLANKSMAVYNRCWAVIDDADESSDRCADAVAQLANVICNGLQQRINSAISVCTPEFRQYGSRLPSTCQQAINAVM